MKVARRKNSVEDSRLPCSYCKHKFNTDALGPGLPRLTRGCQRDMKIGSREHNSLLRKWRKDDSHSNIMNNAVGIQENFGCISCCLCTVCKQQYELIEDHISKK